MKPRFASAILVPAFACLLLSPQAQGAFKIELTTGSFGGDTAAIDAFNRGAALWSQYITDDFTVSIIANFGQTPVDALAEASVRYWADTYAYVRGLVAADATTTGIDSIAKQLPTSPLFTVDSVKTLGSDLKVTTANGNAMGDPYGDGLPDATITFSSALESFDFDNGDGVGSNLYDFESVVAHEIGHVLGFVSSLDFGDATIIPTPLDLFRFSSNPGETDFSTATRNLTSDSTAVTSNGIFDYEMSRGTDYQAGHWLQSDPVIGLMNPTLGIETVRVPSVADLYALDLIGYDINYSPVPELTTLGSGFLLLLGAFRRRREPGCV
jgi:hypothetical protein